jgi:HK97 family phage portal protein
MISGGITAIFRAISGMKEPEPWLLKAFGGGYGKTLAGTEVGENDQLEISVNLACIELISQLMGSLRPNLFIKRKDGGRDIVTDDPLQRAINIKPNDEMSGFSYRQASTSHIATHGNAYTYAPRNGMLQIKSLYPLHPDRVIKRRANDRDMLDIDPRLMRKTNIVYDVTVNGTTRTFPAKSIMHTPGFTENGLLGIPLVHFQRLKLGIAKALDEYEARWYGRGIHPTLIGEAPEQMNNPKMAEWKQKLEEDYAGLANAHGMMIVDAGIKVKDMTPRLDWAMLDEAQKRMATRICGLWRVPPSLIGILDRATFNNISHLDLQFGKYCIGIWAEREEQQMMCDLLTDTQLDQGMFIKYPIEDMYRTDLNTLNQALKEAWDRGVITKNEWREKIGRNPVGSGNLFYVPSNFQVEGAEQVQPTAEKFLKIEGGKA